jgi:hypothetical protein
MQGVADKIASALQDAPDAAGCVPQHLLLTRQQMASMVPATPVMHSYAHVWWCRVLFGPLHQALVGLEAGETTELVNAYFSSLADAVRNMSDGSKSTEVREHGC